MAVTTYDKTVLADEPKAYWKLDEPSGAVAADSSGNGLNATITGTGFTYGVAVDGKIEAGLTGNGSGYIAFPSLSAAFIDMEFSLEFWFYTASPIDATSTLSYLFGSSVANTFLFYTGNGAGTNDFAGLNVTNVRTSWVGSADTITSFSAGWHHVVLTEHCHRDCWSLWVDGVEVAYRDISNVMPVFLGSLASWYAMRHSSTNYAATLSCIAMYGYALSPSQIKRHYETNLLDKKLPKKGYVWDASSQCWVSPTRPAMSVDFSDDLDIKKIRMVGTKRSDSECYRNGGWLQFLQYRSSDNFRMVIPCPEGATSFSFTGYANAVRNRFGPVSTSIGLCDGVPTATSTIAASSKNFMGCHIASDTDFYTSALGLAPIFANSGGATTYGADNPTTGYLSMGTSGWVRFDVDVSFANPNVTITGTVTGSGGVISTGTRTVSTPAWAGAVPTWTHFLIGSYDTVHGTTGSADKRYYQQVMMRQVQFA